MPIIPNLEGKDWYPRPDFEKNLGLRHCYPEPETIEGLIDLMDDMGAVDAAEVYRFLDPIFMREIITEEAERVAVDMRGDYYTAVEAVYLYMARQSMQPTTFGIVEDDSGSRSILIAS